MKQWLRREMLLGIAGALVAAFLILFLFSGLSSSQIQKFQSELEQGNVHHYSSINPLRWFKASGTVPGFHVFEKILAEPAVDLTGLKSAYPGIVAYAAYHPNDAQ